MYSMSKFFQCAICVVSLDFQFMRIVFSVIVRATRSNLLFVLFRLIVDMSPSKQSEGDNGMWQPMKRDSDSVISFQKCLMGAQCQVP